MFVLMNTYARRDGNVYLVATCSLDDRFTPVNCVGRYSQLRQLFYKTCLFAKEKWRKIAPVGAGGTLSSSDNDQALPFLSIRCQVQMLDVLHHVSKKMLQASSVFRYGTLSQYSAVCTVLARARGAGTFAPY